MITRLVFSESSYITHTYWESPLWPTGNWEPLLSAPYIIFLLLCKIVTCHCDYRAINIDGCGIRYGKFYGGPHLREVRLIAGDREEFLSTGKAISRTLAKLLNIRTSLHRYVKNNIWEILTLLNLWTIFDCWSIAQTWTVAECLTLIVDFHVCRSWLQHRQIQAHLSGQISTNFTNCHSSPGVFNEI